jgi:glyoxylase-like metal-dependent hydrolase (beta-lactamase superfamily II)
MLEIVTIPSGPFQTNAYLVADTQSGLATVIDPAWDGKRIADEAKGHHWRIVSIWVTHAHFDHLAGSAELVDQLETAPTVALHPLDYPLWRSEGGARWFGLRIDPGPEPGFHLEHGMQMHLGKYLFEVRHVPGHTPGHVLFACPEEKAAFVGDVIFAGGIGRTDLPGGDYEILMESIQNQVLSLPGDMRLFPGHGPMTTVLDEQNLNPFINSGG